MKQQPFGEHADRSRDCPVSACSGQAQARVSLVPRHPGYSEMAQNSPGVPGWNRTSSVQKHWGQLRFTLK